MASINISIDSVGPVGSVPRTDRSDDSEQQQAAIERNIQATRRTVDAARDQPQHQITGLREQAQLDAGSLRSQATFAYGELPMEARWAVLNSADNLDRRSHLFEALLRFFGVAAIPRRIRSVELSDGDDDVIDRPVLGLELYRSLEQVD